MGASKAGDLQARLAAVAQLLQTGKLRQAEDACQELSRVAPEQAAVVHMLALVRGQSGDAAGSEQLMRRSLSLEPANIHFKLNLAMLLRGRGGLTEAEQLLRQILNREPGERKARRALADLLLDAGQLQAAETECRALLAQNQNDADTWTLLAFVLGKQNRLEDAETAYRRALALDPRHRVASHNLGSLLSRLERAEEALELLEQARLAGAGGYELSLNRARTLSLLYRFDEAERSFLEALAVKPLDIDAHVNLARLRFMRGDPEFARSLQAAADARPEDRRLQLSLISVLKHAGQTETAEQRLRRSLQASGGAPELRASLAQLLHESGRLADAETEALAAVTHKPGDSAIIDTLVLILLSRGRAEDALAFTAQQRLREPEVQSWIAYEATAARLLGHESYRQLYDYDRLIRVYELEPPPGWTSVAEFNAALRSELGARHKFAARPLDQSLRFGTQTARNLLSESAPAIAALLQAFAAPLAAYQSELGQNAAHPLSARNKSPAAIHGAWSVQLNQQGFHVNHLHPQGWISSAYYVDVPDEVNDAALKPGWLKFGEPRYPVPDAAPERFVQPVPGRLVLFPAYMWHGTNPIRGSATRTSVAFDAVPKPP